MLSIFWVDKDCNFQDNLTASWQHSQQHQKMLTFTSLFYIYMYICTHIRTLFYWGKKTFYWSRPSKNIISPASAPKTGFKNKEFWTSAWQKLRHLTEWYWTQTKSLSQSLCHFFCFLENKIWRLLLIIMSYLYGKNGQMEVERLFLKYVKFFSIIFPR